MPGPKSEEREIGGTTYKVTQLSAGPARRLMLRLVNVLGPSAGAMMEGRSISQLKYADVGRGFSSLASALKPAELEHVIDVFISNKTIAYQSEKGWPILENVAAFDLHFTGSIGPMMSVVWFGIEVNYKDFLDELKSLFKKVDPKKETADAA